MECFSVCDNSFAKFALLYVKNVYLSKFVLNNQIVDQSLMRNVCPIISCVCFIINRSSKFDVYYANIGNECENVQEKARAVHFDICTYFLICQSKVIDPITYLCINYSMCNLWEHYSIPVPTLF
jgi:hypothetical protein